MPRYLVVLISDQVNGVGHIIDTLKIDKPLIYDSKRHGADWKILIMQKAEELNHDLDFALN